MKILIANRGEIAIRIARSVYEMGFIPIGIYTEQDVNSLHRRYMYEDKMVTSYLDINSIIEAAEEMGADAIHPGYGFLSENPVFASRVKSRGIVFIGPSPEIIRLAGDKIKAKEIAREAGVPTLDWIIAEDPKDVLEFGREVGYPLLIKAAGGGGGMGIRIVRDPGEVNRLFEQARREAENAFKDPRLYVEPYIENARHIEVQIIGDGSRVVHLYERDCSIQRRYQKIVEEAPSPILSPEERESIIGKALDLAEHIEYDNAGTFEMIYDLKTRRFYFMEINARLQVEHPVTEMITGVDIVKEQIRIALGDGISFKQEDVRIRGHSIEVRVNAENPLTMMPSPGVIKTYVEPSGPGIRVDSGVTVNSEVSTDYTPLIAKLIVWGSDRSEVLKRLERALDEFVIGGVTTNILLLKAIVKHPVFRKGLYSTAFMSNYWSDLVSMIKEIEVKHALTALSIAYKYNIKLHPRIVTERSYISYTNGLLDTRLAALKRKAWIYWTRIKKELKR